MKTLVIYHREDNDGVFSAAVVLLGEYEVQELDGECMPEIVGLTYEEVKQIQEGSEKAKITKEHLKLYYDRVVIVDINLGEALMKELHEVYGDNFIWCDHHGPIIEALKDEHIKGCRSTDYSAIWQTWTYYQKEGAFENKEFPRFLNYLQLWDSWTYTPNQKDLISDVNVGTTAKYELSVENAFEVVVDLLTNYEHSSTVIEDTESIGRIIRKENIRKNADIMQRSGDCTFTVGPDNHKACCILYSTGTGSYTFEALKDLNPEVLHGIVLRRSASGTWSVSLYNIDDSFDFHCGEYLKENFGGGGHHGAGGAEITEAQALNILKTKHI